MLPRRTESDHQAQAGRLPPLDRTDKPTTSRSTIVQLRQMLICPPSYVTRLERITSKQHHQQEIAADPLDPPDFEVEPQELEVEVEPTVVEKTVEEVNRFTSCPNDLLARLYSFLRQAASKTGPSGEIQSDAAKPML